MGRAQSHDDTLLFRQSAQIYNQTQANAYSLLNARLGYIQINKTGQIPNQIHGCKPKVKVRITTPRTTVHGTHMAHNFSHTNDAFGYKLH